MAEIKALLNGYREFHKEHFVNDSSLYQALHTKGQSPKTLIIACSDSRVDPAIITKAKPGDLFVIRNVANLVPPYQADNTTYHGTSAAVEFAVKCIKVRNIVVMGHSQCAGIETLVTNNINANEFSFVRPWINIAKNAKAKILEQYPEHDIQTQSHHCEKESIISSLNNLKTFPWIKDLLDRQELRIHGWHFSISDGTLQIYNPESKSFEKLSSE